MAQAASLILFCLLLAMAGGEAATLVPADIFLRMDPLAGLAASLCSRAFLPMLVPSLLVLASAVLAGRLFCGWLCPMGAALDALGGVLRAVFRAKARPDAPDPLPRHAKFLVLAGILAAAACGVNLSFWASPMPLLTRLFALVLHPLGLESAQGIVTAADPLIRGLGFAELAYWQPEPRIFHLAWLTAIEWLAFAWLELVRPRFWCRYLCPAGALMALLSRLPLRRKHVSSACVSCGLCSRACPMGICGSAGQTCPSECLACGSCVSACGRNAVRFTWTLTKWRTSGLCSHDPARRMLCAAAASGMALACLHRADAALLPRAVPLRPPGSVPEKAFLELCLRCGECMMACPTGGLQPAGLQGGLSSLMTPMLEPRAGACLPDCRACGSVCPSHAILPIGPEEKRWAKMGTAVIDREGCLAWAESKRCMVCKENCPYGAIDAVVQPGLPVSVPQVQANRCYGCGYCERHCPKDIPAIKVVSDGAIRIADHSFEEKARAAGLRLGDPPAAPEAAMPAADAPPPGFLE